MIFTLHAYASSSFPTSLGKLKIIIPFTPNGLNCDLCNLFSAILYWFTSRLVCWTHFLRALMNSFCFFYFIVLLTYFLNLTKKYGQPEMVISKLLSHPHVILHTLHSKCNHWILFTQVRKYFWNGDWCWVRSRFEIRELSISPIHIKIERGMAYVSLPSSCTGNALK